MGWGGKGGRRGGGREEVGGGYWKGNVNIVNVLFAQRSSVADDLDIAFVGPVSLEAKNTKEKKNIQQLVFGGCHPPSY